MSHPDNNSHQRAYKERMVEKGFRQLTLEIDERDFDIDSVMDIVRTQEQILATLEQILEVLNKTSASK